MSTIKPLHKELGVPQNLYNALIEKVPAALLKAIQEQDTPNKVKAAAIKAVLDQRHDSGHPDELYCLLGVMVEQAYNAAVLASKKPLFGKSK